MATRFDPLRRCPVCRYDLKGLPANHNCPECGFTYDDTMQIWWVPVLRGWVLFVAWVAAFTVLNLRFTGFFQNGLGLSRAETAAALSVVSAVVPFAGLFFPRGFVAAGREGLSYRFPWRPVRFIPWDVLRVGRRLRIVYRVHKGVGIPLRLPTGGLPGKRRRAIHGRISDRRDQAVEHQDSSV